MWSSVLVTDLLGNPVGELPNSYDRKLSFRLRRMATQTFSVLLSDPLADQLLEGHALVKTYEGSGDDFTLRFVGEVVAAVEKEAEGTKRVEVTCADGFWNLSRRFIGHSEQGFTRPEQDRGQSALDALAEGNALADTGVRPGSYAASSPSVAGPWYFKPVADVISELAGPLDGFDWRISPVEPVLDGAPYSWPKPVIGLLDIAPFFGQLRSEAVFEYGFGRDNVRDYERTVTKEGLANSVWVLPPGFPQTDPGATTPDAVQPAFSIDYAAADAWGLHEAVIDSDLAAYSMRKQLADAHVKVRATPRQVITFSPIREDIGQQVPNFKIDYDIGDIVPFRAVNPDTYQQLLTGGATPTEAQAAAARVAVNLRVYGVDIDIGPEGQEQMTLTLVEDAG